MSNTSNMFKKHLAIFAKKSAKLVIHREADVYYVCDGFTMLKMPAIYYEVYARPVASAFIPLESGQCAIRAQGEALPKLSAPTYDCAKIFNGHSAKLAANITDLMCLGEGKRTIRFVTVADKKVATYNNDYINAVLEYANKDTFRATEDRFPVLKWENEELQLGFLIMPINNARAVQNLSDVGALAGSR